MSGLGLMQAVQGYQQGVAWKQRQDQMARAQAQQQALDAANQEAAGLIKQDQQQHVLRGGDPANYRPPEDLMFKAAEARGGALAKAGLWEQFMENEAKVAPMRLQARAKAVQQYEADRDPVKFVMAVNGSMFNGKDVKGVEKVDGTPEVDGAGGMGAQATKGGVKVTFSDGTSQVIDPDAAAKGIKVGLLDPKAWAISEAQAAAKRLEQSQQTEGQLKVVSAQGENAKAVARINADSRENVADTNAEARTTAAEIRGKYSKETATIRGEFQSLASKARGGSGGRTSDDVQRFKALELSARSSMESIRKELAAKEALLKDAGSKDRPRIVAAVEALKTELDDARGVHSEIIATMRQPAGGAPSGGLSDATPTAPSAPAASAPMEQARAEAVSTKQPVQYDLGGKRGTITPSGGLEAVAPKADPKPAAKKDAANVKKRGETFLPKTAAEYDSLPAGALYERDGKTYRKKG
jgi:hypothetical protein